MLDELDRSLRDMTRNVARLESAALKLPAEGQCQLIGAGVCGVDRLRVILEPALMEARSSISLRMTISIVAVARLYPRTGEIVSSAVGSSHACSLCSHLLPWAAT